MTITRKPIIERLMSKVEISDTGCWIYTAKPSSGGYINFKIEGKTHHVHRVAYEWIVGPIPPGLHIDHDCHNTDLNCGGGPTCIHRRCINPAHLKPRTCKDNLLVSPFTVVGINAAKTHCPKNHPYDEENTRFKKQAGRFHRACRECGREEVRARRAAKREEGAA